jgi:hypothetical protein
MRIFKDITEGDYLIGVTLNGNIPLRCNGFFAEDGARHMVLGRNQYTPEAEEFLVPHNDRDHFHRINALVRPDKTLDFDQPFSVYADAVVLKENALNAGVSLRTAKAGTPLFCVFSKPKLELRVVRVCDPWPGEGCSLVAADIASGEGRAFALLLPSPKEDPGTVELFNFDNDSESYCYPLKQIDQYKEFCEIRSSHEASMDFPAAALATTPESAVGQMYYRKARLHKFFDDAIEDAHTDKRKLDLLQRLSDINHETVR